MLGAGLPRRDQGLPGAEGAGVQRGQQRGRDHRAHDLADRVGAHHAGDAQAVGDLGGQKALAGAAHAAQQHDQGARRLADDAQQAVARADIGADLVAQQGLDLLADVAPPRHAVVLAAQVALGHAGDLAGHVRRDARRQQRLHEQPLGEGTRRAAVRAHHRQPAAVVAQVAVGQAQVFAVALGQHEFGEVVELVGVQAAHARAAHRQVHGAGRRVGVARREARVFQRARQYAPAEGQVTLLGLHQDVGEGRGVGGGGVRDLGPQHVGGHLDHQVLQVGRRHRAAPQPPHLLLDTPRRRRRLRTAGPGGDQRLDDQPPAEGPGLARRADHQLRLGHGASRRAGQRHTRFTSGGTRAARRPPAAGSARAASPLAGGVRCRRRSSAGRPSGRCRRSGC